MLSVVPIKSSSISSGYYLKQDGNYYIENQKDKELYQWFGKGAKELGLEGAIDLKDYENVYSGKLPNGDMIGKKMPDGSIKGRPGYDLTFSMNKDLSLIICATADKALSDYFLKAHIDAVKTVMIDVEKKVQARTTKDNVTTFETTKNITAALCTHFSSRAGDAEVHTHALVANATKRSDGAWRALATDMSRKNGFFEMIRDNATYFGSLYQNEMAYAAKQKGFEVEAVHKNGMFKIKNFSDAMRDYFSKRRHQIEDIVKTLDQSVQKDKKIFDIVAQHSKAAKEKMDSSSFLEKVKSDMQAYLEKSNDNRSFDDIVNTCKEKTNPLLKTPKSAEIAIMDAISHQSQFSVLLDGNKIINKAIAFDLGTSCNADMMTAFNQVLKSQQLFEVENKKYTSEKLIAREKAFIKEVEGACNNHGQSRLSIIKEPYQLKDKADFLESLISDFEKNKKTVKVLSINKSLSNQHNDYARKNDVGLWDRLKRIGKGDLSVNINSFLHEYEAMTKMPLNNLFVKKASEVFIVDDAQRLSFNSIEKLLSITSKRQSNIIFLKHGEGMQSVLSGNPLEIIEKCNVNQIDVKKFKKTDEANKAHIHIDEIKGADRQKEVSKLIVEKYKDTLSQTLILSHSKSSALKLNHLIRDELILKNKIEGSQIEIKITEPLFLSSEEQKHAQFYPRGAFIKTYLGRGQYDISKIIRHDTENNKIIIEARPQKYKALSPSTLSNLIKKNETSLYFEKSMMIAKGDLIRIAKENRQSTLLGLKVHAGYKIAQINDKKIILEDALNNKSLSFNLKKLNGLPISYDYARSVHEPLLKNKKESIVCDLPNYAVNANLISDLKRHTDNIHIITDSKVRAEKRLPIYNIKESAIDQHTIEHQQKSSKTLAVEYGIHVMESRDAAFSLESLIKKSLEYKLAETKLSDIKSEIKNFIKEGVLHYRLDENANLQLSTTKALKLEKSIISQISLGKNQDMGFLSSESAALHLKNVSLTQGQMDACQLITTTKDRFVMVQGYAGTGKSTMLETIIGDKTLDKITGMLPKEVEVLCLAPTHQAVKELQKKNIKAQTLKSFLVESNEINSTSTKDNDSGNVKKLIIVDESSMISNIDFHALQTIVEKQNARCAYLGDIAQLSAVEAGKPSELAYISKKADILTAVMHENKRQTNPELKVIAELLMKGGSNNFKSAFDLLEKEQSIIEVSNGKKDQSSILKLAKDYAALQDHERKETLVAAATNADRIEINNAIRACLIEKGDLDKNGVNHTILDDSRLTRFELLNAEHYKPSMMVKYNAEYKKIADVDIKSNAITLVGSDNQKSLLSLSHLPSNSLIELYYPRIITIAKGDAIKFTKTDRDQNKKANTILHIESIDQSNKKVIARTINGEKNGINLNSMNDAHIDYSYSSTTHGLQAATSKSVMILSSSYNKKSNTMRQLYVALTRAREKAIIYTDDKDKIQRQILSNEGEKTSALEAMGLLEKKDVSSHTIQNKIKNNQASLSSEKEARIDTKLLENKLKSQAQMVAKSILGDPNPLLSKDSNFRYGTKGSLAVKVSGDKAGSFYNFETGEKGGMISLIMSELNLPFKEALSYANKLLGGANVSRPNHFKLQNETIKNSSNKMDANKLDYIKNLIQQSKPIENTIAETYLKNRGINNTKNTDLRFLENITTGGGNKEICEFSSAILAIAKDGAGNAKAIQLTYLDKNTGNKVEGLPVSKRTLNSPQEAFVNLTPNIKNPDITFIAEGVETALSIRDQTHKINQSQVVATLGKNNIAHIPLENTANKIVLVLDNDLKNPLQDASIKKAIAHFESQNKQVACIYPESLNNQKTDYNDLAKSQKSHVIAQDISRAIESSYKIISLSNQKQHLRYEDREKEFLG